MIQPSSAKAAELRSLAAQLRGHALETGLKVYQRKFESMAAELEEAALDAESRAAAAEKRKR